MSLSELVRTAGLVPAAGRTMAWVGARRGGGEHVRFEILGPVRVLVDGVPLRVAGSRQQKVLALLLLDANRIVPLDRLVAAVWDGREPAGARKLVRNAVSMLRSVLTGPDVEVRTEDIGYRLAVPDGRFDLPLFARSVDVGRRMAGGGDLVGAASAYQCGLRLWRGRALEGIDSMVIAAGAARLDEARLVAYEEWLDLELALGRHRDLIGELSAIVAEHPFREALVSRLMIALARSGRQAESLAVYRRARQRLAGELGLDPSPMLCAAHQAVLRGQAGMLAATP